MKAHSPRVQVLATAAWLMIAGILGILPSQAVRAEDGPKLEAIDVQPLPGQQVQLTMRLSGPAPQPLSFTIDNPARISLDLPNTTLALPSRRIDVHSSGLDSILAAEAKDRTRLVLNLDKLVPYETRVDGNNIIVMLGAGNQAVANTGGATPVLPTRTASAAVGQRAIRSIDFRRSTDGAGRVMVKLTDPHTHINLRQVGSQIVVDLDADLPKNLARHYDATDFGTPVSSFEVTRVGTGTRIAINASGDYEQLAYQSDDEYVVEIQPQRKAAAAQEEKPQYTGERLTLNFQDIETRAVLQLLADASGQNIVVSDSVKGNVTLRLQNVPWDQALDIVLRTKGLDKRKQDNVIIVAPQEELATREKAELAARKDIQELSPLRADYLQVNYAKAADMAALIKSQGGGSLLSARGNVAVDERTNTLLLQDTADRLADIRRLVASLDIPVRQVLIEARVVIVNDDFNRQLGARFGYTTAQANGNGIWTTSGTAASTDTAIGSALANTAANGSPFPVQVPTGSTAANRYNVNLPVSSPAGSFALGILGSNYIVDLELSAAQAETNAQIISSPRVITANQKGRPSSRVRRSRISSRPRAVRPPSPSRRQCSH